SGRPRRSFGYVSSSPTIGTGPSARRTCPDNPLRNFASKYASSHVKNGDSTPTTPLASSRVALWNTLRMAGTISFHDTACNPPSPLARVAGLRGWGTDPVTPVTVDSVWIADIIPGDD